MAPWAVVVSYAIFALAFAGCSVEGSDSPAVVRAPKGAADKPLVLTTTLPLYDFTRKLAGDDFQVGLLPPPAVGPHHYSASFKDRERMLAAALVVSNGLALEAWFDEGLTKQLEARGVKVLRTGDRIPKQMLRPNGEPKWGQNGPGLLARLGGGERAAEAEGKGAEQKAVESQRSVARPAGKAIAPIAKAGGKPASVVAAEPTKVGKDEGLESILIAHVHGPG